MNRATPKSGIKRDWQDKLTGASYMFSGINNVIDPYNIPLDSGWLPEATNVDIDNTKACCTNYDNNGQSHDEWLPWQTVINILHDSVAVEKK